MNKKPAGPPRVVDPHKCSVSLCACKTCGGRTWYIDGKHVCRLASCGAAW